ncbi:hypothetical protein BC826DRAFT_130077 [Russula brevipes]|nr:hypothetical protein BC826DRAFT_130077 [Russula brevipes]
MLPTFATSSVHREVPGFSSHQPQQYPAIPSISEVRGRLPRGPVCGPGVTGLSPLPHLSVQFHRAQLFFSVRIPFLSLPHSQSLRMSVCNVHPAGWTHAESQTDAVPFPVCNCTLCYPPCPLSVVPFAPRSGVIGCFVHLPGTKHEFSSHRSIEHRLGGM